jgi:hypothetical protein
MVLMTEIHFQKRKGGPIDCGVHFGEDLSDAFRREWLHLLLNVMLYSETQHRTMEFGTHDIEYKCHGPIRKDRYYRLTIQVSDDKNSLSFYKLVIREERI